jgi:hypothetical protein
MSYREDWNRLLTVELASWAAKAWPQLLADLTDGNVTYEVESDSKRYTVEVDLLENTDAYVHVSVAVDDGRLPESIHPASRSFICKKAEESSQP